MSLLVAYKLGGEKEKELRIMLEKARKEAVTDGMKRALKLVRIPCVFFPH